MESLSPFDATSRKRSLCSLGNKQEITSFIAHYSVILVKKNNYNKPSFTRLDNTSDNNNVETFHFFYRIIRHKRRI